MYVEIDGFYCKLFKKVIRNFLSPFVWGRDNSKDVYILDIQVQFDKFILYN